MLFRGKWTAPNIPSGPLGPLPLAAVRSGSSTVFAHRQCCARKRDKSVSVFKANSLQQKVECPNLKGRLRRTYNHKHDCAGESTSKGRQFRGDTMEEGKMEWDVIAGLKG
ncbi:MAG: hypothetical protein M1830_002361 [Pleopsidium flavum]|nr:MAG: hypothetical protein M1830_002361 [Pleopsidium flavum]